jgi:predicted membrane protein (TIGR00267 family)
MGKQQSHEDRGGPDAHQPDSRLSEVILGGQDGLVNVLGVILGVAAASNDTRIVIAAGLAATFAESISMAAVAFTSRLAEGARYEAERQREHRHIKSMPEVEREEVRSLYRQKGFEGELLERIVDTITSDQEVWVAVMMAEEHRLVPVSRKQSLRSALIVGVSAVLGSLIPLAPFAVMPVKAGIWSSLAIGAVTLFVVGAYKARSTVGHPGKSGLEMALIGTASALAGYVVGYLMSAPAVP